MDLNTIAKRVYDVAEGRDDILPFLHAAAGVNPIRRGEIPIYTIS